MKIAIIGYSGSGKSTLAHLLSEKYSLPVLHFDTVQFLPNWQIRTKEEKERITKDFLDNNTTWVIDGTYSKLYFERRMSEADEIIFFAFNRFSCFFRAFRRYLKYRNTTRPDMAEGCNEKFDLEFTKWILYKGRTKEIKARYESLIEKYCEKVTIIKNQKQLKKYIDEIYSK